MGNVALCQCGRGDAVELDDVGEIYILSMCLDYQESSQDGKNLEDLVGVSGVKKDNCKFLYNEACTPPKILAEIEEYGKRMNSGDTFLFFFSGRSYLQSANSLVLHGGAWLTDADFTKILLDNVDKGVKIIILTDCALPDTIADGSNAGWGGRKAISVNSSLGDDGFDEVGSVFPNAMWKAIAQLQTDGQSSYSTPTLFDKVKEIMGDKGDMVKVQPPASGCRGLASMTWPLVPTEEYTAPQDRPQTGFACGCGGGSAKAEH